jgi:hypothetical protein
VVPEADWTVQPLSAQAASEKIKNVHSVLVRLKRGQLSARVRAAQKFTKVQLVLG